MPFTFIERFFIAKNKDKKSRNKNKIFTVLKKINKRYYIKSFKNNKLARLSQGQQHYEVSPVCFLLINVKKAIQDLLDVGIDTNIATSQRDSPALRALDVDPVHVLVLKNSSPFHGVLHSVGETVDAVAAAIIAEKEQFQCV